MDTEHRCVMGIDPGRNTGWSIFFDGFLLSAGVAKKLEMLTNPPMFHIGPAIAVIEVPRIYPGGSKGDNNDLIDLAVFVGDLQGFYRRRGFTIKLIAPRTWKGTVPKYVFGERILSRLSEKEREKLPRRPRAKDFDHNMLDAIGIGLFETGRMS